MQFCEKLDFLMNLTKTTNSALSFYISLDASYVSRLRSGKRVPAKNVAYLKKIASYFSHRCGNEFQRKALSEVLNISVSTLEEDRLAEHILQWMHDEKSEENRTVEKFLNGFFNGKPKQTAPNIPNIGGLSENFPESDFSIYYGIEGKQTAVINFLTEIIAQPKPQTLLLFSDEATDWMTADRNFAAQWAVLMMQVLAKGNRIKIIHTVNRNLDEMLSAIGQWMPLYMTGAIEPYYYPKIRDGVFKRTFFIAPETAAIISNSVGTMHREAANLLFRNEQAVKAYTKEYMQFLSFCRPLMRIFKEKEGAVYLDTLLEFENEKSDSFIITESLSLLTMPEKVANSIIARIGKQETAFADYQRKRVSSFKDTLNSNSFTEIVHLPHPEQIKNSKTKVAMSEILYGRAVYYTTDEYILHLENIINLLETYSNFHVHLLTDASEDRYMIYERENIGVIVGKTTVPPIVLAINETNMAAAFGDFLKNIIGGHGVESNSNADTAKQLDDYIKSLKEEL